MPIRYTLSAFVLVVIGSSAPAQVTLQPIAMGSDTWLEEISKSAGIAREIDLKDSGDIYFGNTDRHYVRLQDGSRIEAKPQMKGPFDFGPDGNVAFCSLFRASKFDCWYGPAASPRKVADSHSSPPFVAMKEPKTFRGGFVCEGTVALDKKRHRSGLWKYERGQFSAILQRDDPAPGFPNGITFGPSIGGYVAQPDGTVLYWGHVQGPGVTRENVGLWRTTPSGLELITKLGDEVPGNSPSRKFESINEVRTLANGNFVLVGSASKTANDSNPLTIWIGGPTGKLRRGPECGSCLCTIGGNGDAIVAREGTLYLIDAEGVETRIARPGGDLFSRKLAERLGCPMADASNFTSGTRARVNSIHQIVFRASHRVELNGKQSEMEALWFWSPAGGTQLIAHQGMEVRDAKGDTRTVWTKSLEFWLNEKGQALVALPLQAVPGKSDAEYGYFLTTLGK